MLTFPALHPVLLSIGPLHIHWYGLMYVIGFLGGYAAARYRTRDPHCGWTAQQVSDLIFYAALGVIVGGRVGYMLFYDLPHFLHEPLSLFRLWQGGMSFHGGLLGVAVAVALSSRASHKPFFEVGDFLAPLVPIGLGAGRLGNFINSELWGRTTTLPWGMVFPNGGPLPRHPSQIYEFLLEGVVLFIVLWVYSSKPRPRMAVSGLFLVLYGLFRITIEFFREPDPQYGYLAFDWLTVGQLLSLPMVAFGGLFLFFAYSHRISSCNEARRNQARGAYKNT